MSNRCAFCDEKVYIHTSAYAYDMVACKEGELDEPADWTEDGEPICIECWERRHFSASDAAKRVKETT